MVKHAKNVAAGDVLLSVIGAGVIACTRASERMAAAIGLTERALTRFERCRDVGLGGLPAGLPALCGNGLMDGHVRVYHGSGTLLPRRYVSRERLCLRGTADYWVNDALGRPFFVVSQVLTDGLTAALFDEIVPELLDSVPRQPSPAELTADPLLHRFVVVFDREGSTHKLLAKRWERRIGAITDRKSVVDRWPEGEIRKSDLRHSELMILQSAVSRV